MSAFKYDLKIYAGKRRLLQINNFEIAPNKVTFLFGESGIGKSIISKAVFGLLDSESLLIKINNSDYKSYLESSIVREFQNNGFFVFQEPSSHLNPLRTLYKQLNEGSLKDLSPKDEQSIIRFLWDGIDPDFLNMLLKVFPKPYRPSGGEKQRILLAMAFKKIKQYIDQENSHKTAFFIFDEPSGSLDNHFRNLFLQLLMECYKQKPFTALIITHDYSIISEIETKYSSLSQAINYQELSRTEEHQLTLRDFSKDEYLNWINNQSITKSKNDTDRVLLSITNPVLVFGKKLSFYSDGQFKQAVDFKINASDLIYLKAQSGAGKTTIAKIIMGLIKAEKVNITFENTKADQNTPQDFWRKNIWGREITMIFQHADEALNQNAKVWEVFNALPLKKQLTRQILLDELQGIFDEKLKISFLDKKVKFLSGGQKQRVNILRSMLLDTKILIMDEPLNGLDLRSAHKVIEKIKERKEQGCSILLISHNEEIFDSIVDKQNVVYLKAE